MGRGNTLRLHVPDGKYTMKQVADRVGVSRDTVKRWYAEGYLPNAGTMPFGKLKVVLFDASGIKRAQQLRHLRGISLAKRVQEVKRRAE